MFQKTISACRKVIARDTGWSCCTTIRRIALRCAWSNLKHLKKWFKISWEPENKGTSLWYRPTHTRTRWPGQFLRQLLFCCLNLKPSDMIDMIAKTQKTRQQEEQEESSQSGEGERRWEGLVISISLALSGRDQKVQQRQRPKIKRTFPNCRSLDGTQVEHWPFTQTRFKNWEVSQAFTHPEALERCRNSYKSRKTNDIIKVMPASPAHLTWLIWCALVSLRLY